MKKQDHLPMCGVGPVYGAVIILLTVLGIVLTHTGRCRPSGMDCSASR